MHFIQRTNPASKQEKRDDFLSTARLDVKAAQARHRAARRRRHVAAAALQATWRNLTAQGGHVDATSDGRNLLFAAPACLPGGAEALGNAFVWLENVLGAVKVGGRSLYLYEKIPFFSFSFVCLCGKTNK